MPKILELKAIDGELWCRVGKLGEFESGISLWTPEDQQWHHKDSYKSGFEDAKNQWQTMETAPKTGIAIWVSNGNGPGKGLLPVYWKHDKWLFIYGNGKDNIGFEPIHWMPLPQPPKTKE